MLNIKETQSVNRVSIAGILKELDITEAKTADGREYVSCKATIKVDQEVNGKVAENEIPVRLFSMKKKSDGTESKMYSIIADYREKFTSLAACPEDHPEFASRIVVNSASPNNPNGTIAENIWIDPNSGEVKTGWQINAKFLNEPRGEFEEEAKFEMSGVILNKARETDANGEETGRLKIKFAVVGWQGKVEVINLIAASDNAVNFIEQNWEDGDTVNLNGVVSFNQSTKVWYEEQGFGEPIKRTKTETRKELIVLGGSQSGLEEAYSYDAEDIKNGLAARQARVEEMKNKANNKTKSQSPKNSNQFGF